MADVAALSKLTKRADAVAESASVLVSRSIRAIRGELAVMAEDLNLAGSARDRERAYRMIRDKMGRLSRRLEKLLVAQQQLAAKAAAKSASDMTGVEIKYSERRAREICEMVSASQGESLAAVFTDRMGENLIRTLREATVSTMRENAVEGGGMKQMARTMSAKWHEAVKDGVPKFTDKSGREWNTAAYFQMNVRTNTMRVYNDCLIDDVVREHGSDVMRISSGGSDASCECASWEGTLISITGKTKGLPTYEQAKAGGCFHPNCVHTLEYVDEYADAEEIEMAKAHPFKCGEDDDVWEVQDERKYEIDQAVKMRDGGLSHEQARAEVDRDNLAAAIRTGLISENAEAIVSGLTDSQIAEICKDGNPPAFVPFKATKKDLADGASEKWNHGKNGGVVHIKKSDDTIEHLIDVTGINTAERTEGEKRLDSEMLAFGFEHTYRHQMLDGVNPGYADKDFKHRNNCGRCCDAYEIRSRGYVAIASGTVGNKRLSRKGDWMQYLHGDGTGGWQGMYKNPPQPQNYGRSPDAIYDAMARWGDGARAKVFVSWRSGGGHFIVAEQTDGKTVFKDGQSGEIYDDGFFRKNFGSSKWNYFFRTDNLELSGNLNEFAVKPKL